MTVTLMRRCFRAADYISILQAMREFTVARDEASEDQLWQVEHNAVFTLGQAGQLHHVLDAGTIPVVRTERGGQVTFHGPGQAVIYPLIDLRRRGILVREMVNLLEQAMIDTLADFEIANACRKPGAPGVYVAHGDRLAKIGAVGLKVSRGRCTHGIALNVDMDLQPFHRINPCGMAGLQTVDMATMGARADWQSVADVLCSHIEKTLPELLVMPS